MGCAGSKESAANKGPGQKNLSTKVKKENSNIGTFQANTTNFEELRLPIQSYNQKEWRKATEDPNASGVSKRPTADPNASGVSARPTGSTDAA